MKKNYLFQKWQIITSCYYIDPKFILSYIVYTIMIHNINLLYTIFIGTVIIRIY